MLAATRIACGLLIGLVMGHVPALAQTGPAQTQPLATVTDPGSAREAVTALEADLKRLIQERGQGPVMDAYLASLNRRLDDSAGDKKWGDKTGNCRLPWVDHMLRNPLKAPIEAEAFTRQLHEAASFDPSLHYLLAVGAEKLNIKPPRPAPMIKSASASDVLDARLKRAIDASNAALSPLTADEIDSLRKSAYERTTGMVKWGSHVPGGDVARAVFDLLEKLDRAQYLQAGIEALPLTQEPFIQALSTQAAAQPLVECPGVQGPVRAVYKLTHGRAIVGGPGPNTYDLSQLADVLYILEPGGDDTYIEGALSQSRPVLVIVDQKGNDTYRGEQPGIQAGAILGVSILVDQEGDDQYTAQDVAHGACVGGFGLLIDHQGNDLYKGLRRVQGSSIAGVGLLIDRDGNDHYRGALHAQGVGGPLGLGILDDLSGNDIYFAGGHFTDGYNDSPGYDAWSQGCGYGPRGTANGGLGVLLDGQGDDSYESDYFSLGSGYWFAAGFARDFAGNDTRHGATRTMLDGSARKEPRFLRYGICFGCHYALGFLFDDRGDDTYLGSMAGHGFAWDFSVGVLVDTQGNDTYNASGGNMQGVAAQAGLGVLLDTQGDDSYKAAAGSCQGFSNPRIEYHKELTLGGNFSYLFDWSGTDKYSTGATNNTITQNGSPTGLVVDTDNRQGPVK